MPEEFKEELKAFLEKYAKKVDKVSGLEGLLPHAL